MQHFTSIIQNQMYLFYLYIYNEKKTIFLMQPHQTDNTIKIAKKF